MPLRISRYVYVRLVCTFTVHHYHECGTTQESALKVDPLLPIKYVQPEIEPLVVAKAFRQRCATAVCELIVRRVVIQPHSLNVDPFHPSVDIVPPEANGIRPCEPLDYDIFETCACDIAHLHAHRTCVSGLPVQTKTSDLPALWVSLKRKGDEPNIPADRIHRTCNLHRSRSSAND